MPRGGSRTGTPGKAYGNRSDLNANPRQLPVARIPGQPYGAQADQVRAQQAIPVVSSPPVGPSVPSSAAPAQPTPLTPLGAPTKRPNEPVTAGSPSGPGPGPDPMSATPSTADDLLRIVAPTSPQLAQLYDYLSRGGQ